jgi:hypothetical protein
MDLQWERLGEAVLHRRTSQGWTQQEVWDRGGPSDSLQTEIESKRWKPTRTVKGTIRKIDTGMEWVVGSASEVLGGGEPTPLPETVVQREEETADPPLSPSFDADALADEALWIKRIGDRVLENLRGLPAEQSQEVIGAFAQIALDIADALLTVVEQNPSLRARYAEGYTESMMASQWFLKMMDTYRPESRPLAPRYAEALPSELPDDPQSGDVLHGIESHVTGHAVGVEDADHA